jgi:hypothetical protein
VSSSAAVNGDGTVFVGSEDKKLEAVTEVIAKSAGEALETYSKDRRITAGLTIDAIVIGAEGAPRALSRDTPILSVDTPTLRKLTIFLTPQRGPRSAPQALMVLFGDDVPALPAAVRVERVLP